jgi:hypothetical protein
MVAQSRTSTWPASVAAVGEDRVVPTSAVVGHVRVGHEEVVGADAGHAAAALRAGLHGHELADTLRSPMTRRVRSPGTSGPGAAGPPSRTGRGGCRPDRRVAVRSPRGTRGRCRAPMRTSGRRCSRARPSRPGPARARARPAPSDPPRRRERGDLQQEVRLRDPVLARRDLAPHAARAARRWSRRTSRRSWSPGTAGRRNFASSMPDHVDLEPARVGRLVSSQMPAAWARLSMSSTPGITGAPGKWPSKNSSDPVTFLSATSRPRVVLQHAVHEPKGTGWDLADEAAMSIVERQWAARARPRARPLRSGGGLRRRAGAGLAAPRPEAVRAGRRDGSLSPVPRLGRRPSPEMSNSRSR